MDNLQVVVNTFGVPVLWALIGITGVAGVVALISPRAFRSLATGSSRWVDTQKFLAIFDKRVEVDGSIMRHTRILGLAALLSVGYLALVLTRI